MTAQPTSRHDHPLVAAIEDAHDHAVSALDDGRHLDAVVWLSAHLAATQRTLPGRNAADHDLEVALRRTEQRHSGDSLAAQLDPGRLDRALRDALAAHSRNEHVVLAALVAAAPSTDLEALHDAYAAALRHAPTRPHPHAPHRGLLGAAAFRVDAWRDRVMDTMDGRHVPSPRTSREVVTPGRWGRYLLGEMEQ